MTLEESLARKDIPKEIKQAQTLLDIPYLSFEGTVRMGQLLVHTDLAREIQCIFEELLERKFPIEKMIPVVAFDWNDDASMAANNTSAFNYRVIHGTDRLSNHSFGRALDINPVQNPYVRPDGTTVPQNASYESRKQGTITHETADLFRSRGWEWGGDWRQFKDWQHFEKPA
ncbi:TPA: peptidase M15 [Candidatus Kaiserbacteria bacterium]|nr:MAG: hypothetical protein UY93_C0002G0250 [Parcubacteria group bacterium GW2011_GWA1_56_13]KKW46041.1 MAG: hypothetical protein UY97_C0011G0009 [Parcubacteria group bacterium GW2011_GWB1_57_6]HCR52098.1 peptidase M15 [Candidatus Kaiserbacteria bacterium]